jgi:hypothetical protein
MKFIEWVRRGMGPRPLLVSLRCKPSWPAHFQDTVNRAGRETAVSGAHFAATIRAIARRTTIGVVAFYGIGTIFLAYFATIDRS